MLEIFAAYKVPIFGVILVPIQSESEKMRTRITPNTDTFHAVLNSLTFLLKGAIRKPNNKKKKSRNQFF